MLWNESTYLNPGEKWHQTHMPMLYGQTKKHVNEDNRV